MIPPFDSLLLQLRVFPVGKYTEIFPNLPQSLSPHHLLILEMPAKSAVCASIGDTVEVYWPDDKCYYAGTIADYDNVSQQHRIIYDDGDIEQVTLSKEQWRYKRRLERKATSIKRACTFKPCLAGSRQQAPLENAVNLLSEIFTAWLRRESRCHLPTCAADIANLAIRDAIDQTTFAAANGDLRTCRANSARGSWLRDAREIGVGDYVRGNYAHWKVPLSDSEWEVEKEALVHLSHRVAKAKEKLLSKKFRCTILSAISILLATK